MNLMVPSRFFSSDSPNLFESTLNDLQSCVYVGIRVGVRYEKTVLLGQEHSLAYSLGEQQVCHFLSCAVVVDSEPKVGHCR